jgi:hypothetical protein
LSVAAFAALETPFPGADRQFWADLLKEGFNCQDPGKDGDDPVMNRGERMENIALAVALWGPRRYISGSKFP